MSREILFRGKRVDNGEWMYGSLVQYANGLRVIHQNGERHPLKSVAGVIPETVGQYTGKDTSDGQRIFQGDKFQSFYHPEVLLEHTVEWSDRLTGWYMRHSKDHTDEAGHGSSQLWVYLHDKELHYEIVGTIHDSHDEVAV